MAEILLLKPFIFRFYFYPFLFLPISFFDLLAFFLLKCHKIQFFDLNHPYPYSWGSHND